MPSFSAVRRALNSSSVLDATPEGLKVDSVCVVSEVPIFFSAAANFRLCFDAMIVRKLGNVCVRVWRGREGRARAYWCGLQYANVIGGCKRKSAERMNRAPDGLPLSHAGGRGAAVVDDRLFICAVPFPGYCE